MYICIYGFFRYLVEAPRCAIFAARCEVPQLHVEQVHQLNHGLHCVGDVACLKIRLGLLGQFSGNDSGRLSSFYLMKYVKKKKGTTKDNRLWMKQLTCIILLNNLTEIWSILFIIPPWEHGNKWQIATCKQLPSKINAAWPEPFPPAAAVLRTINVGTLSCELYHTAEGTLKQNVVSAHNYEPITGIPQMLLHLYKANAEDGACGK